MKAAMRTKQAVTRGDAAFTLVEVMVAMAIAAMATGGVFQSLSLSKGLNQANGQRVVAFGLCSSRLEQVKGMDYEQILSGTSTQESAVPLTHLGGVHQVPIAGTRSTAIRGQTNPERKEIVVAMTWTYRGRQLTEQLTGLVYPK